MTKMGILLGQTVIILNLFFKMADSAVYGISQLSFLHIGGQL